MLELRCACERVHLRLRGAPLRHFECYCRHCQASMAWIESHGGKSARSASGGDQSLLVYSDEVEVLAGEEELGLYAVARPVRTLRVYSRCCHTALGSTFVGGLPLSALKTAGVQDPSSLPPLDEHINVASAPPGATPGADGKPCRRGMGWPMIKAAIRALTPGGGHGWHRWVPDQDVVRV